MPASPNKDAQAPKRQRGHLRVAAIMEAAMQVFTEKGFDAATMTEIAARSATAIGSMYRFFPSKEALADALLLQYAHYATSHLAELEQTMAGKTPADVAKALVGFTQALQLQRRFAISLVDARSSGEARRAQFRATLRDGIARILRKAAPDLSEPEAQRRAIVVSYILKTLGNVQQEDPAIQAELTGEIEGVLRGYLGSRPA